MSLESNGVDRVRSLRKIPTRLRGMNFCTSLGHEVASEFFRTNTPDPPHWTLTSCFYVFRTIWMHLGPFNCLTNSVQNGSNWCKSLCHEVASEFFATNSSDPPHWTLNCRFGGFRTIWVHSGPFDFLTKPDAKRAELVQKFMPRSRV